MARRFTQQQQRRFARIQAERQHRLERRQAAQPTDATGALQHGTVVANHGAELEVESVHGARVRCTPRSTLLETPVCGDQVGWRAADADQGVIETILPRRTLLQRIDDHGRARAMAANIDRILIVAALQPEPDRLLIDRLLVAAELTAIEPMLILNKIDLADAEARHAMDALVALYHQLGYTVLESSTIAGHGLDAIHQALSGLNVIFTGQSGVGKSSLLNALLPDEQARTGALHSSGHGTHTTSTARLYPMAQGGAIIDSPGIRDFGLDSRDPAHIAQGFPEFAPFLGQCRFRNCRHLDDSGCAIRDALEQGIIDPRRFESWRRMTA